MSRAGPELHDGGDDEDRRHQPVHRVEVERHVHEHHQAQAGGEGDLPLALQRGQVRRPVVRSSVPARRRAAGSAGWRLAARGGGVAGLGDGGGQLVEADLGGVEADGGDLGGQVDLGARSRRRPGSAPSPPGRRRRRRSCRRCRGCSWRSTLPWSRRLGARGGHGGLLGRAGWVFCFIVVCGGRGSAPAISPGSGAGRQASAARSA